MQTRRRRVDKSSDDVIIAAIVTILVDPRCVKTSEVSSCVCMIVDIVIPSADAVVSLGRFVYRKVIVSPVTSIGQSKFERGEEVVSIYHA